VRLLVLLPLVGRRFLPGGIHEFFYKTSLGIFPVEFMFSLFQLLPISPLSYTFLHALTLITLLVLNSNIELQRHTVYGLYIADVSFTGLIGYFYHYKKLSNVGRVPQWLSQLYQVVTLIEFPLHAITEFIILFMGLKYINGYEKLGIQLILLIFIPLKFQLYKRLIFKFFRIESDKVE
jgi:hypothetical protein